MKLPTFVTGFSALILLWVAITFFAEVPVHQYPATGAQGISASASKAVKNVANLIPAATEATSSTVGLISNH